ncbi:DUF4232 domain-containing protein [Phytoactinopolyspora mesophila]|uniref:DUF4232 domain-containing protein n=1 Tax=Phytoactinopolyspora mesophila TaxID=2650750 RepID=UPI001391DB9B
MTRSKAALFLLPFAVVLAVAVWRPWEPALDELREAIREAERLPGVVSVDMQHRESTASVATTFGPEPSEVDIHMRLDATLTPDDAAATAENAHALLVPAADVVARDAVSVFLRVSAGESEDENGVAALPPLELRYTAASGAADIADAFTIWQAGARQVSVYGTGSPLADTADAGSEQEVTPPPASIGITAADAAGMVPLAELAAELGRSADLHVAGDNTHYNGYGALPDADAVRLAVDAASRPGVESVSFSDSTAPHISVGATWPAEAPETQELSRWLEEHDYATDIGLPVAFTVSEPGYATLTEGWVSAFSPPEPEAHSLPLPADVEAWPDDPSAPACTSAHLDVRYGGSDAATGARYAALRASNVSDGPCAIEGAPGIRFGNADGVAQKDITIEPYSPGVIPARLVVPPGEQILAPLKWRAMSTANDPDVTTTIDVTAVPDAEPVSLDVTEHESSATGLDILDGGDVRLGPWVQALEGWS